jgi:hypothetical protein
MVKKPSLATDPLMRRTSPTTTAKESEEPVLEF